MSIFSSTHQKLLNRSIEFYYTAFSEDSRAKDYLYTRSITDNNLFSAYKIGFSNGTLLNVLPSEGDIIKQLKEIGILNVKGTEHFYGCVTFPLYDLSGNLSGLYGRRIASMKQNGAPDHLYLPGERHGLFNWQTVKAHQEVILTEAIIDSLTLIQAGIKNTIPCYGTNGLIPEHIEVLKKYDVKTVYVCFDNDEAGQKGAQSVIARLKEADIQAFAVKLSAVKDINEFFSLTADAKDRFLELVGSANPAAPKAVKEEKKKTQITKTSTGFNATINGRFYEVIGITKGATRLKAVVRAILDPKSGKPFCLDTVEFYSERSRSYFIQKLKGLFNESEDVLTADINELFEIINHHDLKEDDKKAVKEEISEQARNEAMALLTNPEMFKEIISDIETLGYTGEDMNKLLCYLVVMSRKMDEPLSIIILSRSAAGKSFMQDTVLLLIPEDGYEKYTRLTDQALFYMGDKTLVHKVLAVEELAGANGAIYSIRSIQSSSKLCIAYTTKDPVTGKMTTEKNVVEGPIAVFITTTNGDIDEETASRYIFISMDESEGMTKRILQKQREEQTLSGMQRKLGREAIIKKYLAVDELLKPYGVINPYAEFLTFTTKSLRARRDQKKYLNLILIVAFMYQYQRKKKQVSLGDKERECVFVTLSDIEMANIIANEVLRRTLDELSAPARTLLVIIQEMVLIRSKERGIKPEEYHFTRRTVRDYSGWSDYQIKTHIKELEELEYIYSVSGKKGKEYVYELVVTGKVLKDRPFMVGLIDIEELKLLAKKRGIIDD